MGHLIDNDLFFASIYGGHAHHQLARGWLDQAKPAGWWLATETWLAAMRLLMNPTIMGCSRLDGATAWEIIRLETEGQHPAKILFPDKPPSREFFARATGHRQVMDTWLIQLAKQKDLTLATMDRALNATWPENVMLVSSSHEEQP